MLPQIDVAGQQKLIDAKVLILGVGGLGCPLLLYLVSCGVGTITIVDPDVIELSNLQRQILFGMDDLGRKKVDVAQKKATRLNSGVQISSLDYIPDNDEMRRLIDNNDIVVDGTDNFAARYRHNKISVECDTPLVSGAVIRFEGQVTTFDRRIPDSPCYYCLYPEGKNQQLNCSENGVLGPVAGMIATIMATETVKLIIGTGESLAGRLLILDALHMEWRTVKLSRDPQCSVCSKT